MFGCRELMDGTERLQAAGVWPPPGKVFDSPKSYQHTLKGMREPHHLCYWGH